MSNPSHLQTLLEDAWNAVPALRNSPQSTVLHRVLAEAFVERDCLQQIEVRPLAPGVSGAKVFLVESQSRGTRDIPLVLKCGHAHLIDREILNYRKYVAPKLRSAPRLLHHVLEEESGAVLFELAGTVKAYERIQTLRDYFESRKDDRISPTLVSNVIEDLRSWHDGVHAQSGKILDALLFDRCISLDAILRSREALHSFAPTLKLYDLQLAWETLSKSWTFNTFHISVQHGDLNVGNILIDIEQTQSYVIDFASVQQDAPVFRDLAKVFREVLLRLHTAERLMCSADYLAGLEALLASFRIFLGFAAPTKPLHHLPQSFESAFSLSMNFGPWCRSQIERIEERCGLQSDSPQLTAELLTTILFQCSLLLLRSESNPAEQEIGVVYVCQVLLAMLCETLPHLHAELQVAEL